MRKNMIKPFAAMLVAGTLAMTACTDVESITINEVSAVTSDARYAQYLSNLTAYKNADHKVVYGWFDNSEKTPYSRGQHITSVPDSVDFIVMTTPELEDFELSDIESVHEKGTKVLCLLSYDDIEDEYESLASGSTALSEDFATYLLAEVESVLSLTGDYDGLVVEFTGQDPDFMFEEERESYVETQNSFLNRITTWKSENESKMLSFFGKPQNLDSKTFLQSCEHIILDSSDDASTAEQLTLLVMNALEDDVPTDRFVMMASTVSLSSTDTETGYWSSSVRALSEVAYWVTVEENGDFDRVGMAILDIQNDYYATDGYYTYVKEAINIMNPAPVN